MILIPPIDTSKIDEIIKEAREAHAREAEERAEKLKKWREEYLAAPDDIRLLMRFEKEMEVLRENAQMIARAMRCK